MPQIAVAPSGRAGCRFCRKKIAKDSYRIGVTEGSYRYTSIHWHHVECFKKTVDAGNRRAIARSCDLDGYSQLPTDVKDEVRRTLWPNLPKEEDMPRLKVLKDIDKMIVADLQKELTRRDLSRSGRKAELIQRLQKYLSSKECQKQNKILVLGFCREQGEKYRLSVPMAIQGLVCKWYQPLFVKNDTKKSKSSSKRSKREK